MSRMKSIFLLLLLTGIVGLVPMAQAVTTVEVTIAGSSAMWQTLALGAFAEAGSNAGHWTSGSNLVNLTDSRVTPVNNDAGTIWIVWNSTATKVWSFNKVDSVVGDRCYFAQPQCSVNATLGNLTGSGAGQISPVLWGADSPLPSNVQSLFVTGTPVNVAATDIRPEDANFAACRVNSALGAGPGVPAGASDGLDGLGYNPNNQPGVCPAAGLGQANYVGTSIKSGYPGAASTDAANVLAFNIKGKDPISGTSVPAFTVVEVGVEPIVFIAERASQLAGISDVTTQQLQQAFSGKNCDASAFGLSPAGINVFLREPLSGTYNVTESNVMRHPDVYPGTYFGLSMETGVNGAVNNPLAGQSGTCTSSDGKGARYRAIGTGEEVKSVLTSSSKFPNGIDGIGFAFFSYGNVGSIANNPSYAYVTLNDIDPIFASYGPQSSTGAGYDPGQPAGAGVIPGAANLPSSCSGAFPCPENEIWAGGLSFPNVRNGTYSAWSLLRLASNGSGLTAAEALVKASQAFVVDAVPDYIPATKTVGKTQTDPGLLLVRSHYQQYDGNGNNLGDAAINCGKTEAGGDMGGIILPFIAAKTCPTTPTQHVQGNQGLQVRPVTP